MSATPLRRVMAVGSCLLRQWPGVIEKSRPGCPCDFYLVNNLTELPAEPPRDPNDYDFQLVQLPLRTVLPDRSYFRLPHGELAPHEALLAEAEQRLQRSLSAMLRWNVDHGLLTFVFNFVVPQMNPLGRLLPRYDLRNMVYFVERLNQALATYVSQYRNAYLFDFEQLLCTFGKKYFCDDAVWQVNHGAALEDSNVDLDGLRIEPIERVGEYFPLRVRRYQKLGWNELVAMYRTIRQIDAVKLVAVDVDDTLWRGVAAETSDFSPENVEGWPLGLVEALGYLKRRGVLLALLSRNDEKSVARVWEKTIFSRRLSFDDFALRKINWRPKADNLTDILRSTGLLPRNVVFVDDNPVERAAIKAAFPDIRAFGPNPYLWRRILLWSPETQVASITPESASRTESIKAQLERDDARLSMSREDFLASLRVKVELSKLDDVGHARFPRALELLNKTNQFNTTGKRWTTQECASAFHLGSCFWFFSVKDIFVEYGMVGVVVVRGGAIEQLAMSCRVIGLDVEVAVLAHILRDLQRARVARVTAAFTATDTNLACRDVYRRCGFTKTKSGYRRGATPPLRGPSHVSLSVASLSHGVQP